MSNIHGSIIDALTSTSGYHQLINSPTHLTNTRSYCIYLSFFSNPSLITEFGIDGSLYTDSCHHSIVLGKMNLSDPLLPPYIYVKIGTIIKLKKNIQRSIKTCNWTRLFINLTNERMNSFPTR